MLQERWEELVNDIEYGGLSTSLELDGGVRLALEKLLEPDPSRAAELRSQFSDGFQGVALRVWPHLHLALTVDSGSHQIYGELLRQHYCKDLPFYSPFYAATEGNASLQMCSCHILLNWTSHYSIYTIKSYNIMAD